MKKKNEINEILSRIYKDLDIPDSLFEEAKKSYDALGEYLDNHIDSSYKVSIFPQGSMRLGTIIKPVNDVDDYDLDAVCLVTGNIESPSHLKNLIGDILKSSDRYSNLLTNEEGTRCWTLEYANVNFHMDVLPATPNSLTDTQLKITHKIGSSYKYKYSNPVGYAEWFENKQKEEKERILTEAKQNKPYCETEDLDKFRHKYKTTLQKAIQILKRHRDIMYVDDKTDSKPISIIITTLVASVYTGKENIYELIEKFTNEYMQYLKTDLQGNYIIENPVDNSENFADKWITFPERKKAFFEWVKDVRATLCIGTELSENDNVTYAKNLTKKFKTNAVNDYFNDLGNEMRENRTSGSSYISVNSASAITTATSGIRVKDHTFYGN